MSVELLDAMAQEILTLKEHIAFLESREVCAAAHDNVEACGYCQRDALAIELTDHKDLTFKSTVAIRALESELAELREHLKVERQQHSECCADYVDAVFRLDAYMIAESLAVSHIMTLNRELNHWADYCDCDCDACRDLANTIPGSPAPKEGKANG
jgi:hypothetical protein